MKCHQPLIHKFETHNTRAPEMWQTVISNVDFENKSVLDLGCGGGDMLIYSCYAGAREVHGVDKNANIIASTGRFIDKQIPGAGIVLSVDDVETMKIAKNYDIIICFSVLPYLRAPGEMLKKIRRHSAIALIEMQYAGDGNGPKNITNNKQMIQYLLKAGWKRITNLGYTELEIRDARRSIWRCRNEG